MLGTQLDVQQPQKVPDLGGGAHRALAPAAREALLNGHRGWNAVDGIDLGPAGRLHDAAGVGVERFEVAALAFVEQDIERQRGFSRAADAGNHVEAPARNLHRQALQVVFAGVDNFYAIFGLQRTLRLRQPLLIQEHRHRVGNARAARPQRSGVVAQRRTGVRARVLTHCIGRAFGHQLAAAVAAFGSEVDEPIGGRNHVQVVLNDDQRVAAIEQPPKRPHQLGDVVKVQAGGRLVKQKQRAAPRQRLAAARLALGRAGEKARQLEPLRLASAQRRHRLTQLHVLQPHFDDRRQGAQHFAVVGEQGHRFAHGQRQHIGHRQGTIGVRLQFLGLIGARR